MKIYRTVQFDPEERFTIRRACPDAWLSVHENEDGVDEGDARIVEHIGTTANDQLTYKMLVRAQKVLIASLKLAERESNPGELLVKWGWDQLVPQRKSGADVGIFAKSPDEVAEDVAAIRVVQAAVLQDAVTLITRAVDITTPPEVDQ